jgi:O-antigen ligase
VAQTIAITAKSPWYRSSRLAYGALVVLVLTVFFNSTVGFPVTLSAVLATQLVLFVLLMQRPVWAIAALIIGQLTTNNLMVPLGGTLISLRFLWTILALVLLVPILYKKGGVKLGSRARRIIIPAIIFSGWIIVTGFMNTDLSRVFQDLRMIITWLVILVLMPAVVKNERDVKRLALVALITCSVSAVFALQQHYQFLDLSFLGLPKYELYGVYDPRDSYYRVSGLSESAVQLGFNLPVILLPMAAIFFGKGLSSRNRKLLLLLIIVISAALYFTYTRSGIYSLAPGLLLIVFLMKGKAKKGVFLTLLIVGIAFLIFTQMTGSRYSKGFGEEGSATGRLVLWQAGVNIAIDNPVIGIGSYRFEEASLAYASAVDPDLMHHETGAGRALGQYEAHNDFITIWASYGTVALLAFLWLILGIFRNFLDAYRNSRSYFLKRLALGCSGAVAAYIVSAFTHNVLGTSMLIWLLGGLSIATTKIALSRPLSKEKRTR